MGTACAIAVPSSIFTLPSSSRLLSFCVLVAALVAVLASDSRAADASPRRPNVVLIVSDDQGYADLGCYGSQDIKTPNLDRLAAEGVRLTDFYVAWPACTPSRGALLTGRYPQRNGLYDMIRNDVVDYGRRMTEAEYAVSPEMTLGLDLREVTIGNVLHDAGYATGMIGKWDSGRAKRFLPPSRGFDAFYGFANTGIDYYTHERYGVPSMFRGLQRTEEDKGTYATDVFRRESLEFVRNHADEPFFLYLAFNAPHSASNLEKDSLQIPAEVLQKHYPHADPADRRVKYMGMVTAMDDAIGDLLDALDEHKLRENTLIVFHSDNGGSGPADNTPLKGRKATMWEGGLRVPCIVSWPAQLPRGQTCPEFLSALDVLPTIAAAAGGKLPDARLDGFNMLPVLRGEEPSQRTTMFWQRREDKAARVGHFKWLDSENGTGLYDLSKDIGETHDLSAEQPQKLAELQAAFEKWRSAMDASEPRGPFRDY